MAFEERDDRVGEGVVAITGHHVARATDVDVLGVGRIGAERLHAFRRDDVAHPSRFHRLHSLDVEAQPV